MLQSSGSLFRLDVCSQWKLSHGDRDIPLAGRKVRALLTYLVLEKHRTHARETLARLLWDIPDEKLSRASLRQALLQIRKSCDDSDDLFDQLSRSFVAIAPDRFGTDLDSLQDRIRGDLPGPALARHIGAAGDMFPGLDGISKEFDDWLRTARQHALRQTLGSLEARYVQADESAAARLALAEAAYALDDLSEPAVRTMMLCHAELNNRPAALSLYRQFYDRLEADMDAEPSVETQDLAVRIKLEETSQPAPAPRPAQPVSAARPPVLVAVLPLQSLGPNRVPSYILLGLLDQITCQLASFEAPAVISSNTTRRYMDDTPTLETLRRDLNANYAVFGSIRVESGQACVAMQLVESESNSIVWSKIHYCGIDEVYDLNAPIANEIAQAVVPFVNVAELRRVQLQPVEQLEPFHLMLRAKDLIFQMSRDTFFDAGDLLQKALEGAPHFSQSHALMAEWHSICVWQGWGGSPAEHFEAIERHARNALMLAPNSGRAMALLGHNRVIFNRQYDEAIELFEQALEANPNDAETLIWTVPTLAYTENTDSAVQNGLKSLKLSPLDPLLFRNEHFLSLAHYAAGNFNEAIELGLKSYQRNPNFSANIRVTVAALTAVGRGTEGRELVERHRLIEPGFTVSDYVNRQGFRDPGRRSDFGAHLISAGLPR